MGMHLMKSKPLEADVWWNATLWKPGPMLVWILKALTREIRTIGKHAFLCYGRMIRGFSRCLGSMCHVEHWLRSAHPVLRKCWTFLFLVVDGLWCCHATCCIRQPQVSCRPLDDFRSTCPRMPSAFRGSKGYIGRTCKHWHISGTCEHIPGNKRYDSCLSEARGFELLTSFVSYV